MEFEITVPIEPYGNIHFMGDTTETLTDEIIDSVISKYDRVGKRAKEQLDVKNTEETKVTPKEQTKPITTKTRRIMTQEEENKFNARLEAEPTNEFLKKIKQTKEKYKKLTERQIEGATKPYEGKKKAEL